MMTLINIYPWFLSISTKLYMVKLKLVQVQYQMAQSVFSRLRNGKAKNQMSPNFILWTWKDVYSPSHIVQITYFFDFLHENCEEESETFSEF